MLSPAACLVSDPPLYEEPPPTPPVFDLARAEPFPGAVLVVRRTGSNPTRNLLFTVPFRSDDRGERIFAALHLDYNTQPRFIAQQDFLASTFDDLGRQIIIPYDLDSVPAVAGCHSVTLLASHESTWKFSESRPNIVDAENDRAMAVWWLNFDPPEDDPDTLRDCPSPVARDGEGG